MKETKFTTIKNIPTVEEYLTLRKLGGLSAKSKDGAKTGLKNSFYSVTIRDNNKLIGMGRIVVDPAYQGQGLGKLIVKELVQYIHEKVDEQAYVNLIADGEAYKLYSQFGFIDTWPKSRGMYLKSR
jgi:GNAT superfamily N-acetyltransferase